MYQRILVTTDGSPLSEKAVSSAVELAALMHAELVALNVVPHYPQSYFEGALSLDPQDIARVEAQWSAQAQAVVDAIKASAAAKGVAAQAVTTRADLVAEAVIAAAKKYDCDLIVMASHGRRGIRRVLLGSETQHVLTHSHIPVLVLR